MRQLTADTKIRVRRVLAMPRRRELTGDTRVRLDKIVGLKEWHEELVKDGKARPENSISPDGTKIKKNGEWVPRTEAKEKSNSSEFSFNHGDLYKSPNGSVLRVKSDNKKGYTIEIKLPGKKTIYKASYSDLKFIEDYIKNWKATKVGNDPKTGMDKIDINKLDVTSSEGKKAPAKPFTEKPIVEAQKKQKPAKKEPYEPNPKSISLKGINSKINRRIADGKNKLKASNEGMPRDWGTNTVPISDSSPIINTKGEDGRTYSFYETPEKIDKFLRPRALKYFNSISEEKVGMLNFYTYQGDKYLNGIQRGNIKGNEKTARCFELLDETFKGAPELGADLLSFRKTDYDEFAALFNDGRLKKYMDPRKAALILEEYVGKTYINKSYVSTNINEDALYGCDFRCIYRNKKEQKPLYISPVSNDELFSYSDATRVNENKENELLINRNQSYKISKVELVKTAFEDGDEKFDIDCLQVTIDVL